MGWKVVRPRTIPFLTEKNKKERLEFTKKYENYSFFKVIFADERKIDIFRNTNIVFYKCGEERPFKTKSNSNI